VGPPADDVPFAAGVRVGHALHRASQRRSNASGAPEGERVSRDDLATPRADYAREIAATAQVKSEGVVRALEAVPRERFLGPGPWQTLRVPGA
jgi:hypothetical protein